MSVKELPVLPQLLRQSLPITRKGQKAVRHHLSAVQDSPAVHQNICPDHQQRATCRVNGIECVLPAVNGSFLHQQQHIPGQGILLTFSAQIEASHHPGKEGLLHLALFQIGFPKCGKQSSVFLQPSPYRLPAFLLSQEVLQGLLERDELSRPFQPAP